MATAAAARRFKWMVMAYVVFHATAQPVKARLAESWLYLLEWARAGGTEADPVPGVVRRAPRPGATP